MAVATLIFGIISIIAFILPPYFSGLGGVLAVIGSSIVLCCAGKWAGGHTACAVMCLLAFIVHIIGVIVDIVTYIGLTAAANTTAATLQGQQSGLDAAQAAAMAALVQPAVASWIAAIFWPAIILCVICAFLELLQTIFSFQARSAIMASRARR